MFKIKNNKLKSFPQNNLQSNNWRKRSEIDGKIIGEWVQII